MSLLKMCALRLLWVCVVACAFAACAPNDGFGVALTIDFDISVTGAELSSVTALQFVAAGVTSKAELGRTAFRTERVVYRPAKGTQTIQILVEAVDANGTVVADGISSELTLKAGETTTATVELYPAGQNDLGIDLSADMGDADVDGAFAEVTYATTPVVPTATGPVDVAVGDFDGDGNADVAVAGQTAGEVQVFFGTGDGTLPAMPGFESTTAHSPVALAVADFTGDGKPDIQVLDQEVGVVTLLENSGNRTFTAHTPVSVAVGVGAMAAGDLDGDNLADLVIGSAAADKLWVIYANGTTITPSVDGGVTRLHVADIDGDGALDILACEPTNGAGTLQLLRNLQKTTAHSFATPYSLAATAVVEVLSFDFSGDGEPDIWAYTPNGTLSQVTQYTNMSSAGAFGFSAAKVSAAPDSGGTDLHALAIDVDGDGKMDVLGTAGVATDLVSEELSVALSSKNAPPVYDTVDQFYSSENGIGAFAATDLNNDGTIDLVVANQTSNTLAVALGSGGGSFVAAYVFAYASHPRFVDFNGDGNLDIAIVSIVGSLDLCAGNGKGGLAKTSGVPTNGATATQSTFADFNQDGKLDVAMSTTTGTVLVALGTGPGTFGPTNATSASGVDFIDIVATDISGDDVPDLVLLDPKNGGANVVVLTNNGSGTFSVGQQIGVTDTPLAFSVRDFSGDGKNDVVVLTDDGALTSFVASSGQLDIAQRVATNVSMASGLVAISTLDVPHLGIAVSGNSTQLMQGNGDGTFTGGATVYTQRTNAITAADVDGDGVEDLLVITDDSFIVLPRAGSTGHSFEFAGGSGLDDIAAGNLSRSGFADVVTVGIRPSLSLNTTK